MNLDFLGVPKNKLEQLSKRNIVDVESFLKYLPRDYLDFTQPKLAQNISDDEVACILLQVRNVENKTSVNGRSYVSIWGKDKVGRSVYIRYFNASFMLNRIEVGKVYAVCAKFSVEMKGDNRIVSAINPVRFSDDIKATCRIQPVYKKIYGMSDDYFLNLLTKVLMMSSQNDYADTQLLTQFNLITRSNAFHEIHQPTSHQNIEAAKKRILFDNLFLFNFLLHKRDACDVYKNDVHFISLKRTNQYIKALPYDLTDGQKAAVSSIMKQSRSDKRINALVQGDVGCGKTEVAKIAMLMAYDAGKQAVLMAPTQVLAEQHAQDCLRSFDGIPVVYLFGGMKKKARKDAAKVINSGQPCIVVGTHTVFADEFEYPNLGIVIVDEEHKFGVAQREVLQRKSENSHYISMSATPIPRTLALALYGDHIQVLNIKTLPKGKKPIITKHITSDGDAISMMNQEIKKGHQVYVVCPFVEDSDNDKFADVESVESVYDTYKHYYERYNVKVGMINGRMKADDVKAVLDSFYANETKILISTTMVEVGVNVPNSSVILIKNSERFGLSQLHQLRGRVGRGQAQGYCILQSICKTDEAKEKTAVMCATNDGFIVAQKDLEMRGMGEFLGTSQSGDNQLVCLMMANPEFNNQIKEAVETIFKDSSRAELITQRIEKLNFIPQEMLAQT